MSKAIRRTNLTKTLLTLTVCALSVVLVAAYSVKTYAYSNAYLEANLRGGVNSAIDWDSCRQAFLDYPSTSIRTSLNYTPCAYNGETWLSGKGVPKVLAPIDVQAGTTSVDLQINSVRFLAGPLVVSNFNGSGGKLAIYNDNSRWANSGNSGNDRAPNAIGTSGQKPALVSTYKKITRIEVESKVGTVTGGVGATFETRRNDSTRYWFASPVPITYKNDNITDGLKINIIVYYQEMNSYYKGSGNYEVFCVYDSSHPAYHWTTNPYDYGNIEYCPEASSALPIEFNIPYTLDPGVTIDKSLISPGETMTGNSTVDMGGGDALKSDNTTWTVTRFIYNVAPTDTAAKKNSSQNPCDAFSGEASCVSVPSDPESKEFLPGSDKKNFSDLIPETVSNGARVCYVTSLTKPNSGVWSHSDMKCATTGRSPKVQILGGDLWVGVPFAGSSVSSNVNTGVVTKSGTTFGSWVEYGIFAVGTITGTGSGSAYSPAGLVDATVCAESKLSFANAADSTGCKENGAFGNYATTRSIPDVAASFPKTNAPTIGTNDIADQTKTGIFTASGQLTLNGGTLKKGRWLVINAPGADVTINGNITYTSDPIDPYKTIYDIPQLVIIAKNITIAESVTQVDAWLIAKGDTNNSDGVISTCVFTSADPNPTYKSFPAFPPFPDTSSLGLTLNKCNQKLTINGPVMAQKLYLLRTAGSGTGAASGDPAEVINLRPDAYLWAAARSVVSGRLQTVYSTELPPRL